MIIKHNKCNQKGRQIEACPDMTSKMEISGYLCRNHAIKTGGRPSSVRFLFRHLAHFRSRRIVRLPSFRLRRHPQRGFIPRHRRPVCRWCPVATMVGATWCSWRCATARALLPLSAASPVVKRVIAPRRRIAAMPHVACSRATGLWRRTAAGRGLREGW